MKKYWFLAFGIVTLILTSACDVRAQQVDRMVEEYIRKISEGRYDEVVRSLPASATHTEPLARNNPGLIYLEGLIAPDGTTALRMFRMVSDSLPANPWRDDALARIFEIYTKLNDRGGAEEVLQTMRTEYPQTPYITTGYLDRVEKSETGGASSLADSTGRIVAVYAIQVGAFSVMGNAEKLAGELKAKGFDAIIYDNLLDGKNLLHLVWVGRFDSREDAAPVILEIEKLTGIRGVIREQMIWRRW
jgi:hypothetical protein